LVRERDSFMCFFLWAPVYRWMFEKYDGIRGFWNPLKKAFYSRYGKTFAIPDRILDVMPKDSFLEGEIWFLYPLSFTL